MQEQENKQAHGLPMKRIRQIMWAVLLVVAGIVYFATRGGGSLGIVLNDTNLSIASPDGGAVSIAYEDITSVELTAAELGEMQSGTDDGRIRVGYWRSDRWGQYTLRAYDAATQVIVVKTADQTLVFSEANDQVTAAVYQRLEDKVGRAV